MKNCNNSCLLVMCGKVYAQETLFVRLSEAKCSYSKIKEEQS